MYINLIGAAITFVIGIAVSLINFLLSKYIIKRYPEKYSMSTIFRSLLQILFLVVVFIVGTYTPADNMYLLIGAVLGLSVASFFFTYKLLKLNQSEAERKAREAEISNEREDDVNG